MWGTVKGLIGGVAPTIAAALGGPLAGGAVKLLCGALGLDEGAGERQIVDAISQASTETLLALRQADNDFKIRMKELDIDLEKIEAADRDSARRREQAVGGYANPVLAAVVLGGFFAAMLAVLFGAAGGDPATATLVGAVVGYASAKADQVVGYYFGSSHGSRQKDGLLAGLRR